MGLIECEVHGYRGIAAMTPSAAKAFDERAETDSIVHVELVFDEVVPFFLYALKGELPFKNTESLGEIFTVDNEEVLNRILGNLVPRCGKCVNEVLKRG